MPKKKSAKIRQSKGNSNFSKVINSKSTQQSVAKTPPAPAIKIKKVADFAFDSIKDIPTHLASHVTWTGEGTVQYEPPLNDVGPAHSYPYRIAVTVAGAPVAPTPAELVFRVLPLDPELTVAPLANFELGSNNNIPATIEGLVHHKSTGKEVYEPSLDTIGRPDNYAIAIQVPAHGNYKQSKKLTLSFAILKRTPSFTITTKAIDGGLAFDDSKNEQKMRNAVKVKAGGEPAFEPPLDSVKDPGKYAINVYLEETEEYAESGYQVLNVNILPTTYFKKSVFDEWEQANTEVVKALPTRQFQQKKVEIQGDDTGAYNKRSAIIDALNQLIGVPNRATVWTELGYTLRSGEWDMPKEWTTTLGTLFHLTISADSIIVPKSKAEWSAAPAALFNVLFMSPPVTERVHVTLEATSNSPKRHVYLGNVTGANKAVGDSWWQNQAGEMKPKLEQFKTQMIQKIGDIKSKYKL